MKSYIYIYIKMNTPMMHMMTDTGMDEDETNRRMEELQCPRRCPGRNRIKKSGRDWNKHMRRPAAARF